MKYPQERSEIRVKLKYTGRSTPIFQMGKDYEAIYIYGEERGYKASSLDYLELSNGYRICPYEQKHFWKWSDNQAHLVLKIMYGRSSMLDLMKDLVYSNNPFLKLIPKDNNPGAYIPVPLK